MRLLKDKKIVLVLFVFVLFLLSGCNQNYNDKDIILDVDIFNQIEEEYYVYFYKEDCPYCEKSFKTVNEYLEKQNNPKLYVCNITSSEISRVYEGENGQGTSGKYFVDGVTDYKDLYISGAPSIIKIQNNKSYFVTSGRKNVINFITATLLKYDHGHIHKYNDGVCACGDKQIFSVFFKDSDGRILKEDRVLYGNNATPPQLDVKEGYIFTEWDGDIFEVTKNMSVSAQYMQVYVKDEFGLPQLTEEGQTYIKTLYCEAQQEEYEYSGMYIEKYIGNFNKAEVVKFEKAGVDWVTYEIIEDLVFMLRDGGDFYEVIYQNKVYRLPEAYKENILTYEDIKEIYRLDALWEEYNRFDIFDAYGSRFILTLHGEKQLKEAYYNQFLKDSGNYTIDDVIIKEYVCWTGYGSEKSYRAVIMDYKGSNYTKETYKEQIAGYSFTYDDNNTILVWHNRDKFYTLKDLYSKGLIEDKYVKVICKYYNKKYTVELIENHQNKFLNNYKTVVEKLKQTYLNIYYPNSEYTIDDLEIKELYATVYDHTYIVKIINTKDLKEEDLYKINIGGYEIIDDKNNPILYFLNYHDVSVCKLLQLEEAYNKGFLARRGLHMVELTQENIYYKNN